MCGKYHNCRIVENFQKILEKMAENSFHFLILQNIKLNNKVNYGA